MSVLIKGMEMPKRCEDCGFVNAYRIPSTCGLTGTKILGDANARLDNCPLVPVEPRPKGEWVKHDDRKCWFCSECKADNYFAYSWNSETGKDEFQDNFCPNCGADMR